MSIFKKTIENILRLKEAGYSEQEISAFLSLPYITVHCVCNNKVLKRKEK